MGSGWDSESPMVSDKTSINLDTLLGSSKNIISVPPIFLLSLKFKTVISHQSVWLYKLSKTKANLYARDPWSITS